MGQGAQNAGGMGSDSVQVSGIQTDGKRLFRIQISRYSAQYHGVSAERQQGVCRELPSW